jgi:hypothetical protein
VELFRRAEGHLSVKVLGGTFELGRRRDNSLAGTYAGKLEGIDATLTISQSSATAITYIFKHGDQNAKAMKALGLNGFSFDGERYCWYSVVVPASKPDQAPESVELKHECDSGDSVNNPNYTMLGAAKLTRRPR